jgi:anti-sigma factor RsiW
MAGGEIGDISCQELVELVTDYLEAALPGADRARFEAHLAQCPHCEEYVAQMRQTIDVAGELTAEMITPQRQQQLLEAFRGWRSARNADPA